MTELSLKEGALMVSVKNCQKQGNLRAWGKVVIGVLLTHCFDVTVGDPGQAFE